jgi:hypothetical protein
VVGFGLALGQILGSLDLDCLYSLFTRCIAGRGDLGELVVGAVDCCVHALALAYSDLSAGLLEFLNPGVLVSCQGRASRQNEQKKCSECSREVPSAWIF